MSGRRLDSWAWVLVLALAYMVRAEPCAHGEPDAAQGSVLVTTVADGKGVSARLELFSILDMGVLGRSQVSVGRLTGDVMNSAVERSGTRIATARTDQKGRAELKGLARGVYRLLVRGGPAKERTLVFLLPSEGSRMRVELDLARGKETVTGRVVLKEGATFSGSVRLMAEPRSVLPFQMGIWLPPVRVDEDGSFTVRDVPFGHYEIAAIDDERGVMARHTFASGTGYEPELGVYPRRTYVLEGEVTAEETGKPVAGATVRLASSKHPSGPVKTDAEGRFHVDDVDGAGDVVVESPGYAPGEGRIRFGRTEESLRPQALTMKVVLRKGVTIRGRVVRPDGQSVEGGVPILLVTVPDPGPMAGFMPRLAMHSLLQRIHVHIVKCDARGHYEAVDLRPGKYLIAAASQRWVSRNLTDPNAMASLETLRDLSPGSTHEETIRVVRTAAVQGRVKMPDGRGVEGVMVTASGGGFAEIGGPSRTTISGDGGAFRIEGIVPGQAYTVTAFSREFSPGVSQVTPVAGRTARTDIDLCEAAWLDVRVVLGPDRKPRPGVLVSVRPDIEGPNATRFNRRAVTDKQGRARFGLLPHGASLTIVCLDPELGLTSEVLPPVGPKGGTRRQEVDLGKGKILAGRLLLPAGADPKDVTLLAVDAGLGMSTGSGSVNADGTFRWVLSMSKRARLQASLRHHDTLFYGELDADGGSWDLRIPLKRVRADGKDGTWLIRVRGPDGQSVPHAAVTRVVQPSADGHQPTEPGGVRTRFDWSDVDVSSGFAWLRPPSEDLGLPRLDEPKLGRTWFCVHSAKDAELNPLPYGAVVVGPFDENGGEIEARMPSERRIMGTCVDVDGKALAGVSIVVWPWTWKSGGPAPGSMPRPHGIHARAETDEKGAFTLTGLGGLDYRLILNPPEGYLPMKPRVLTRAEGEANFRFTMGATVVLTFVGPEGEPIPDAHVTLTPFKGSRQELIEQGVPRLEVFSRSRLGARDPLAVDGRTDEEGVVTLQGLKRGALYNLHASVWGKAKLAAIERIKWEPKPETFRFEPDGSTVRGRVLSPDGKPLPSAHVWHMFPRWGEWRPVHSREPAGLSTPLLQRPADGSFSVYLLGDKRCFLWVTMHADARPPTRADRVRWRREVTEARGGPKEVILRCRPGLGLHVDVPGYRPGFVSLNVLLQDLATPDEDARENIEAKPSTVFYGVYPDRWYVVYVLTSDGKRCGRVRNVRPSATHVRVTLVPAGRAHGTVKLPKGIRYYQVKIVAANRDGIALSGRLEDDGTYEVAGLTDEPWFLTAWVERDGVLWVAHADLSKPGEADLELERVE